MNENGITIHNNTKKGVARAKCCSGFSDCQHCPLTNQYNIRLYGMRGDATGLPVAWRAIIDLVEKDYSRLARDVWEVRLNDSNTGYAFIIN